MLLPTMNDEEKGWEAYRVYPLAKEVYDNYRPIVMDKFRRGTKFPYFQRVVFKDDRNNEWVMTFLCKSKANRKNGPIWLMCHTVYEIQKKKSDGTNMYDGNTGKGIIAFDPIGLYNRVEKNSEKGMGMILDIVPHAFNRYTERYLKPLGKENIEFQRKVESIISRWLHFDIMGDPHDNYDDKGILAYDVFMNGGGMLRGQVVDGMLIRFFTYVNEEMMYDNQLERQTEMHREYHKWKREGLLKT